MAAPESPAGRDIERILRTVWPLPAARRRPVLAVLVGLPGTGKSHFAEALCQRTGAVVLESDTLRKRLVARPTYAAAESRRLFEAIHGAINRLLQAGAAVVLDATNLAEREREPLYAMAEARDAQLILVRLAAPGPMVRERLARRQQNDIETQSDADVDVYERMRFRQDRIRRPHYVVDTSRDIEPVLATIAREMGSP
jgi:predicted kinase